MRRPGSTPSNFLFHRYSLASLTGALLLVASLSLPAGPALAQAKGGNRAAAAETGAIHQPGHIVYDTSLYAGLQYRMIGPFRGGRATAVAGVSQKPHTFYLGATGGGVWKTEDAGQHWDNVSDDYFHVGSIGAITVAPSDPDVVYVGTGSADIRGNVSTGKGVYRSTDGGKSWSFEGLEDAGQIGDIVVSPGTRTWSTWPRSAMPSAPTRRAACSAPGTAARPGRKCCSCRTRPGSSTWPWIPTTPGCSTPRRGRPSASRGRSSAAATRAGSGSPPTAETTGPSWEAACPPASSARHR